MIFPLLAGFDVLYYSGVITKNQDVLDLLSFTATIIIPFKISTDDLPHCPTIQFQS
jgi:hypothetical protein